MLRSRLRRLAPAGLLAASLFAAALAISPGATAQPADLSIDPASTSPLFEDGPFFAPAIGGDDDAVVMPVVFNATQVSECATTPAAFRTKIINNLPIGGTADDLDTVRECKARTTANPKIAACLKRVEDYLEYQVNNRMGTTPGGDAVHAQKAPFPPELKDAALFAALDDAGLQNTPSLKKVIAAVNDINTKAGTDWAAAWFGGHVDSVGVLDYVYGAMSSSGRVMLYSTKQSAWANFVISMTDTGSGGIAVNVSILKIENGATYFQDYTRKTNGLTLTKAGAPGNGIKCGQCHASGFLKAYPLPSLPITDATYEIDATALGAVNALAGNRAPFANNLVSVFGGVTVGDATGATCSDDEELKKAAKCGTCHRDGGTRGPLYLGGLSRDVIDRYVTATGGHGGNNRGHMPPSASDTSVWTSQKRQRLWSCLRQDYETRFRAWLAAEPCQ